MPDLMSGEEVLPSAPSGRSTKRRIIPFVVIAFVLVLLPVSIILRNPVRPASPGALNHAPPPATSSKPRVFAYYYLWWSLAHWKASLG